MRHWRRWPVAQAPAQPATGARRPRRPGARLRDREGHVRVRDLSRARRRRPSTHIVGLVQEALLQRPARPPRRAEFRRADGRSADARHDEEGRVGHRRQRNADWRRRVLEDAASTHVGHGRRWRTPATPTKADSQFFIVIGPASHLDGKYPIFGKVIVGHGRRATSSRSTIASSEQP